MNFHIITLIGWIAGIGADFLLAWATWNFVVIPRFNKIAREAAVAEVAIGRRLQPYTKGNGSGKCLFA